jgi:hypothetical protein
LTMSQVTNKETGLGKFLERRFRAHPQSEE